MVTHKIDDALKYGNRLIMLHQGRIVLDLTTAAKQTLTAPALLQIFHHYEDQLLINKE
jgi:putative ABC transport system ATP-binding protein